VVLSINPLYHRADHARIRYRRAIVERLPDDLRHLGVQLLKGIYRCTSGNCVCRNNIQKVYAHHRDGAVGGEQRAEHRQDGLEAIRSVDVPNVGS
jgi:hypothetical protein